MKGCIILNATAKSPVWVHFGFPGNADGTVVTKKRVICCICSQKMPYKNSTSNLFSHLECHRMGGQSSHHTAIKQYIAILKGTICNIIEHIVSALQCAHTIWGQYIKRLNSKFAWIFRQRLWKLQVLSERCYVCSWIPLSLTLWARQEFYVTVNYLGQLLHNQHYHAVVKVSSVAKQAQGVASGLICYDSV